MDPITIAGLVAAGLLIVGRKKSGGGKATSSKPITKEERQYYLNEIRSMSDWYYDTFNSMPFLSDYLITIAYRESRFNPNSINKEVKKNPTNAARGLFGMRPKTVFKESNGLKKKLKRPNDLLNPKWSFVCAVDHIWRADIAAERKGYVADWVGVRRWWGIPNMIHDTNMEEQYSKDSLSGLEKAIRDVNKNYDANVDENFLWMPVKSSGYPGMKALVKGMGLKMP